MAVYFVANILIQDEQVYEKYLAGVDAVFAIYNGEYLAVDRQPEVLEGVWNYSRAVLIRFNSQNDFNSWYFSPDYQEILRFRLDGSACDSILIHGK